MSFTQSIQQNYLTALLFWIVFGFSILVSRFYQKNRISYCKEGNIKINNLSLLRKNIWTVLIIILPSLLIGFRDFEVGADTMNNAMGFLRLGGENYSIMRWDRIADSIFRYTIFILTRGNATFFLFSMSFFTLFILIKALDKWIAHISLPLALFVYYALFGMQLLNQSRQLIALSFFLYAIPYLVKHEYKYYLLLVLIASLFHFTASIGIIFSLFYFKKSYYAPLKKILFYLTWTLSPFLMYPLLITVNRLLPSLYQGYIEIASYSGIGLGLLITLYPIIIPLILYKKYINDFITKYLARIALLTYPLRFAGYYSYFLMRLNYYSSALMVLLIPLIFTKIKGKTNKRFAIFIFLVIYMSYYIIHYMYLDAGNIFPYKLK